MVFPFLINLGYKINTTHGVTLPVFAISVSSKLELFKTEECISSEKKCETLKQIKRKIWPERLFWNFKSYGRKNPYSIFPKASPTVTERFEE